MEIDPLVWYFVFGYIFGQVFFWLGYAVGLGLFKGEEHE